MKHLSMLAVCLTFCLVAAAQSGKPVYLDPTAPIEARVQDALGRMTLHEKVQLLHAQSKFTSAGVPRLGIRQLNMSDGTHGVRAEVDWNSWNVAHWTNDSIVAFPSLTCLAATWNPAISRLYGHSVSEEFTFRGKDIMLGPGCNIARGPLCGRNFEYMGEDPYLAGELVAPFIKSAQEAGVACCLKHFFLNNQEIDRFTVNVNVSERAVEEIYLPAFEKAVKEGGLWTIMGSYNLWKGVHCCQNDELLNGILKKRWGFDGAVVSDWSGVTDTWQAATGGMDIEMGSFTDGKLKESEFTYDDYYLARPFEKLVREGKVPMSTLDDKASRVLRTIFRTAMNPERIIGSQCSEAHYAACREIAGEGITLLRNNKAFLPLDGAKYKRILVVGENATRSLTEGGGSSELKTKYDISPLQAISEAFPGQVSYTQGYASGRAMYDHVDKVPARLNDSLRAAAIEAAKTADLIIYIGGLNKNTRQDCENGDRESYDLPYGQNEQITDLAAIQKNIIVITCAGNAYATPWIDKVQGLVQCWYLGSTGAYALADVLTGQLNPSGRLPVTFAKRQQDYPMFQYGQEGYPGVNKQVYYKEGIFVGYRHFDTHKVKPQFPFGFGLSYTTFRYSKPRLSATQIAAGGKITVEVDVTNTGRRAGKETVQLYIGDDKCTVERPAKELKGFRKVSLEPGQTKTVSFDITERDLQYYSETEHKWTAEPGTFTAYLCASSEDVRGKAGFRLE